MDGIGSINAIDYVQHWKLVEHTWFSDLGERNYPSKILRYRLEFMCAWWRWGLTAPIYCLFREPPWKQLNFRQLNQSQANGYKLPADLGEQQTPTKENIFSKLYTFKNISCEGWILPGRQLQYSREARLDGTIILISE